MNASLDRTRELVTNHGWTVFRSALMLLVLGLLGGCDSGPSLDGDNLEPGSFALVVGGEFVEGRTRLVTNDESSVVEAYLFMENRGFRVSLDSDSLLVNDRPVSFEPRSGGVLTPTEDGYLYESGTVRSSRGAPGVFRFDLEFKQRPFIGFGGKSISVEGAVRL